MTRARIDASLCYLVVQYINRTFIVMEGILVIIFEISVKLLLWLWWQLGLGTLSLSKVKRNITGPLCLATAVSAFPSYQH